MKSAEDVLEELLDDIGIQVGKLLEPCDLTIQQVIIVRDINNATLKACNELIRLRIKSRKEATIG